MDKVVSTLKIGFRTSTRINGSIFKYVFIKGGKRITCTL